MDSHSDFSEDDSLREEYSTPKRTVVDEIPPSPDKSKTAADEHLQGYASSHSGHASSDGSASPEPLKYPSIATPQRPRASSTDAQRVATVTPISKLGPIEDITDFIETHSDEHLDSPSEGESAEASDVSHSSGHGIRGVPSQGFPGTTAESSIARIEKSTPVLGPGSPQLWPGQRQVLRVASDGSLPLWAYITEPAAGLRLLVESVNEAHDQSLSQTRRAQTNSVIQVFTSFIHREPSDQSCEWRAQDEARATLIVRADDPLFSPGVLFIRLVAPAETLLAVSARFNGEVQFLPFGWESNLMWQPRSDVHLCTEVPPIGDEAVLRLSIPAEQSADSLSHARQGGKRTSSLRIKECMVALLTKPPEKSFTKSFLKNGGGNERENRMQGVVATGKIALSPGQSTLLRTAVRDIAPFRKLFAVVVPMVPEYGTSKRDAQEEHVCLRIGFATDGEAVVQMVPNAPPIPVFRAQGQTREQAVSLLVPRFALLCGARLRISHGGNVQIYRASTKRELELVQSVALPASGAAVSLAHGERDSHAGNTDEGGSAHGAVGDSRFTAALVLRITQDKLHASSQEQRHGVAARSSAVAAELQYALSHRGSLTQPSTAGGSVRIGTERVNRQAMRTSRSAQQRFEREAQGQESATVAIPVWISTQGNGAETLRVEVDEPGKLRAESFRCRVFPGVFPGLPGVPVPESLAMQLQPATGSKNSYTVSLLPEKGWTGRACAIVSVSTEAHPSTVCLDRASRQGLRKLPPSRTLACTLSPHEITAYEIPAAIQGQNDPICLVVDVTSNNVRFAVAFASTSSCLAARLLCSHVPGSYALAQRTRALFVLSDLLEGVQAGSALRSTPVAIGMQDSKQLTPKSEPNAGPARGREVSAVIGLFSPHGESAAAEISAVPLSRITHPQLDLGAPAEEIHVPPGIPQYRTIVLPNKKKAGIPGALVVEAIPVQGGEPTVSASLEQLVGQSPEGRHVLDTADGDQFRVPLDKVSQSRQRVYVKVEANEYSVLRLRATADTGAPSSRQGALQALSQARRSPRARANSGRPIPKSPAKTLLVHSHSYVTQENMHALACDASSGLKGIVRFVGTTDFGGDNVVWVGLELLQPVGEHNGKVSGRRYFETEQNCGHFAKAKDVRLLSPSNDDVFMNVVPLQRLRVVAGSSETSLYRLALPRAVRSVCLRFFEVSGDLDVIASRDGTFPDEDIVSSEEDDHDGRVANGSRVGFHPNLNGNGATWTYQVDSPREIQIQASDENPLDGSLYVSIFAFDNCSYKWQYEVDENGDERIESNATPMTSAAQTAASARKLECGAWTLLNFSPESVCDLVADIEDVHGGFLLELSFPSAQESVTLQAKYVDGQSSSSTPMWQRVLDGQSPSFSIGESERGYHCAPLLLSLRATSAMHCRARAVWNAGSRTIVTGHEIPFCVSKEGQLAFSVFHRGIQGASLRVECSPARTLPSRTAAQPRARSLLTRKAGGKSEGPNNSTLSNVVLYYDPAHRGPTARHCTLMASAASGLLVRPRDLPSDAQWVHFSVSTDSAEATGNVVVHEILPAKVKQELRVHVGEAFHVSLDAKRSLHAVIAGLSRESHPVAVRVRLLKGRCRIHAMYSRETKRMSQKTPLPPVFDSAIDHNPLVLLKPGEYPLVVFDAVSRIDGEFCIDRASAAEVQLAKDVGRSASSGYEVHAGELPRSVHHGNSSSKSSHSDHSSDHSSESETEHTDEPLRGPRKQKGARNGVRGRASAERLREAGGSDGSWVSAEEGRRSDPSMSERDQGRAGRALRELDHRLSHSDQSDASAAESESDVEADAGEHEQYGITIDDEIRQACELPMLESGYPVYDAIDQHTERSYVLFVRDPDSGGYLDVIPSLGEVEVSLYALALDRRGKLAAAQSDAHLALEKHVVEPTSIALSKQLRVSRSVYRVCIRTTAGATYTLRYLEKPSAETVLVNGCTQEALVEREATHLYTTTVTSNALPLSIHASVKHTASPRKPRISITAFLESRSWSAPAGSRVLVLDRSQKGFTCGTYRIEVRCDAPCVYAIKASHSDEAAVIPSLRPFVGNVRRGSVRRFKTVVQFAEEVPRLFCSSRYGAVELRVALAEGDGMGLGIRWPSDDTVRRPGRRLGASAATLHPQYGMSTPDKAGYARNSSETDREHTDRTASSASGRNSSEAIPPLLWKSFRIEEQDVLALEDQFRRHSSGRQRRYDARALRPQTLLIEISVADKGEEAFFCLAASWAKSRRGLVPGMPVAGVLAPGSRHVLEARLLNPRSGLFVRLECLSGGAEVVVSRTSTRPSRDRFCTWITRSDPETGVAELRIADTDRRFAAGSYYISVAGAPLAEYVCVAKWEDDLASVRLRRAFERVRIHRAISQFLGSRLRTFSSLDPFFSPPSFRSTVPTWSKQALPQLATGVSAPWEPSGPADGEVAVEHEGAAGRRSLRTQRASSIVRQGSLQKLTSHSTLDDRPYVHAIHSIDATGVPPPRVGYPLLKLGNQRTAVLVVQELLCANGITVRCSGVYERELQRKVRYFQETAGIIGAVPEPGAVDSSITWPELLNDYRFLGLGDASGAGGLSRGKPEAVRQAVRALQQLLVREYKVGLSSVDGIFDEATARAVRKFQSAYGLPSTGATDGATWACLLSGVPVLAGTAPDGLPNRRVFRASLLDHQGRLRGAPFDMEASTPTRTSAPEDLTAEAAMKRWQRWTVLGDSPFMPLVARAPHTAGCALLLELVVQYDQPRIGLKEHNLSIRSNIVSISCGTAVLPMEEGSRVDQAPLQSGSLAGTTLLGPGEMDRLGVVDPRTFLQKVALRSQKSFVRIKRKPPSERLLRTISALSPGTVTAKSLARAWLVMTSIQQKAIRGESISIAQELVLAQLPRVLDDKQLAPLLAQMCASVRGGDSALQRVRSVVMLAIPIMYAFVGSELDAASLQLIRARFVQKMQSEGLTFDPQIVGEPSPGTTAADPPEEALAREAPFHIREMRWL